MAGDAPVWLELAGAIAIPLAIAALPFIAEWRRRRGFLHLLDRELGEIAPEPLLRTDEPAAAWSATLPKRFVHEALVTDPSANHEFLLSLPPGLLYDLTQMWNHFHKAEAAGDWKQVAGHGRRFSAYLRRVLDARNQSMAAADRWSALVDELEPSDRVATSPDDDGPSRV